MLRNNPTDSFETEGLTKAFPSLSDEDLPLQPIDMHMTPDGTRWWVAGMEGEIKEVCVGVDILNLRNSAAGREERSH